MTQPNYYEFLGVARDASAEQINKAFREKALVLHPDKNKTDPNAAQQFKVLTQAYQILADPTRRKKYDATLPPPVSAQPRISNIEELWRTAAKLFFEQSERFTPAVDAMRYSCALSLEDERMLIIGMAPTNANLIGYLNPTNTRNHVRRILTELYGKPLDYRIINGTTLQEWQSIKEAEEKVRLKRTQGKHLTTVTDTPVENAPARISDDPDEIWNDTMDTFVRAWSNQANRAFPQTKARYVLEQLPLIARAEDVSRAAGVVEENLQRALARAIERLANVSGIEITVVALEYVRYRSRVLGGLS